MKYRTKAVATSDENARERANRGVAYRAASEGIVLLENKGALPLKAKKVALYGAGATHTVKGGTGSGEVNERYSMSIKDGLLAANIDVTSKTWLNDYGRDYDSAYDAHKKVVRKLFIPPTPSSLIKLFEVPFTIPHGREISDADISESDTDTCVYVVARQAGEGADRKLDNGGHTLTDIEIVNLKKCASSYKNFIVVINVGSSFDVSFFNDITGIGALVFFAQQGEEGGSALADILVGKVSPSGKLADSWAKKYDDIPFANEYSYLNGDLKNEAYKEGVYVGYRYFDTFDVAPLYPFGYGLSYTDFKITAGSVSIDGDIATVTSKVTNTGNVPGKEIVQAYISCPQSGLHKPFQQLAGFAKTKLLSPGASETVEVSINLRYLATYVEKEASYVLDAGDYVLWVGNSSRNTKAFGVLELAERIIVSKHQNICPQKIRIDELEPDTRPEVKAPKSIKRYKIDGKKISTSQYKYDGNAPLLQSNVEDILSRLTKDELVEIVIGTGMKSVFFTEGYFIAPGAVGQTTSNLTSKGLINATLADGPAGLRLHQRSIINAKGTAKMVDPVIQMLDFMPKFISRFLLAKPRSGEILYQYTTAFPVALALAQTWNQDLVSEVGKAIGMEMLEYGIMFWLGPGMNLHRNPLCGRNFEYFSEDPLLSGKLAAAITTGCQSVGGVYATLKHYVANNQEDNRMRTSANLSERTLREIYLRGFEIAVRESAPGAIMTAYNKVNGEYSPNSHDLNTKVLRHEWGFKGVVMTDWISTSKGLADNGECMRAGNDLIMPGGKFYRKALLASLASGAISEDDLRKCAANIVHAILNSALAKEYPIVKDSEA